MSTSDNNRVTLDRRQEAQVPARGFTHGGKFHSDDVFATALLRILRPDIEVERGFSVPEEFDGIVYDIGRGKFDHHQEDKEYRDNEVPYAAFGLLWREYGAYLVGEEEAARFDEHFIQPLDLSDNTGCSQPLAEMIAEFNPGWDDDTSADEAFWKAEAVAEQILNNHFESVYGIYRAKALVQRDMEAGDGQVLILSQYAPWKSVVVGSGYIYVVYPSNRGGYSVQGVPREEGELELICDFPEEWCGKEAEQLRELTGIEGLRFCHPNGFLCAAETLEDAVAAARLSIRLHQS